MLWLSLQQHVAATAITCWLPSPIHHAPGPGAWGEGDRTLTFRATKGCWHPVLGIWTKECEGVQERRENTAKQLLETGQALGMLHRGAAPSDQGQPRRRRAPEGQAEPAPTAAAMMGLETL